MFDNLSTQLYQVSQYADGLVYSQLNHLSPFSVGVIFLAGLLTSLTPCTLSMLPLTLGYLGGYGNQEESNLQTQTYSPWWLVICFSLGLATTLAGLGVLAAGLGKIYGQIGVGLPVVVSLIAIVMGLNLLELLPFSFPTLDTSGWISDRLAPPLRGYLIGLTFGLIASPCSTPVLATLLAWIIQAHNLALGGGLLLAYTAGSIVPIAIAGTFAVTLKKLMALRQWSGIINTVSGFALVGFGLFSWCRGLTLFKSIRQ